MQDTSGNRMMIAQEINLKGFPKIAKVIYLFMQRARKDLYMINHAGRYDRTTLMKTKIIKTG